MSPLITGIAILAALNILFKPVPDEDKVRGRRGSGRKRRGWWGRSVDYDPDPTTHVHIYNGRVYQIDED